MNSKILILSSDEGISGIIKKEALRLNLTRTFFYEVVEVETWNELIDLLIREKVLCILVEVPKDYSSFFSTIMSHYPYFKNSLNLFIYHEHDQNFSDILNEFNAIGLSFNDLKEEELVKLIFNG